MSSMRSVYDVFAAPTASFDKYSEFLSLQIYTSLIPGYTRHKGRVGSALS